MADFKMSRPENCKTTGRAIAGYKPRTWEGGLSTSVSLSSSDLNPQLPVSHLPRLIRRLRAKPDKKIVDGQAAIPSWRKTPFMASRRSW